MECRDGIEIRVLTALTKSRKAVPIIHAGWPVTLAREFDSTESCTCAWYAKTNTQTHINKHTHTSREKSWHTSQSGSRLEVRVQDQRWVFRYNTSVV